MKLLNLNVSVKLDNTNGVINLIKENAPDAVTLQEVLRALDEKVFAMYNSSNLIKHALDYEHSFFGSLWVAKYHKKNHIISRNYGGPVEQGNEVLSRFPIIEAKNIFYHKDYAIFKDVDNFKTEDHGRALTEVILNLGKSPLKILNVHGTWSKDKLSNERSDRLISKILSETKDDMPVIIAGDFNLLPEASGIRLLSEHFRNLIAENEVKSTRPSFKDNLDRGDQVCDYIFVNDKIKVNSFEVLKSDISDHFPLMLDFELI